MTAPEQRRIVVGVNGQNRSLTTLRFAFDEARMRNASVEIIVSWRYPDDFGMGTFLAEPVTPDESAKQAIDSLVAKIVPEFPDVAFTAKLVYGHPADALIDAAQGALLLVVGGGSRRVFSKTIVGSVGRACATRSPCPLVVVPATRE